MREDDFDLGDLIWVDFEFEDDEKDTLHPAIVLQDQGEIIAVLSGTSNQTPEHLIVRNEMFTSFEISPYCLEDNTKRSIRHDTYFKLDYVKEVRSDKVKSRIGRLNQDRLEELRARSAVRLWFSSCITEQNNASRWDLICWGRNELDSNTHVGLDELNFGVVVGKLGNGKLRILRECENREQSPNSLTFSSSEVPLIDIGGLTLKSKPITISSAQVFFVIDSLPEDHIRKVRDLPYIRFSKNDKGESGKPQDLPFIGRIVCLKHNKEIPLLVVGYDESHFYAFKGAPKGKKSSSGLEINCDLPGFQEMICFDIDGGELTPHNLHTTRFVIDGLGQKDFKRLSSHKIVKILKSLNR